MKFVPNKEHSRIALIFCFHLKKTAAESYRLLGEAYDEHAPSQKRVNDDFSVSKLEISMLQTRNTENRSKSTKTWNCKHCWMKMIHKHKNNSQSNWALVINKLFPITYERWERFRKSADGCHMNWTRDRWRGAKIHVKFCSNDTKEKSFLHRIVTEDKKWIFFENPKRKKSWVDLGAPFTSTARLNRFGRKTMLRVWWDQKGVVYYELLKPGETVNTKRYQQQLIDLNRSLLKTTRIPKEATQGHFSPWQCSIT